MENSSTTPQSFTLLGNYPNPFNPSTTLNFTLSTAERVELSVYSITGQKVRTLLSGPLPSGAHTIAWDGRDNFGMAVSSGLYIAHLSCNGMSSVRKMLLMK